MIKVLFLASNPSNTHFLRLDEEIRSITQKVRASDFRDTLQLISVWAVRPDDLLQALNEHKPQVVHFSGHGNTVGEIILMDNDRHPKTVSAAALKALFKTLKDNIRVVILNACHSEIQAKAITEFIDCVIGMNSAIGDQAAITFASSFYRAIGFGRSVQEAFEQGNASLLLEDIQGKETPNLLVKEGIDASQILFLEPIRCEGKYPHILENKDFLRIDDIFVKQLNQHIILDVRLRNQGTAVGKDSGLGLTEMKNGLIC